MKLTSHLAESPWNTCSDLVNTVLWGTALLLNWVPGLVHLQVTADSLDFSLYLNACKSCKKIQFPEKDHTSNMRSIWLLSNNISFGIFNKYQKTWSFISYSAYWDNYIIHGVVFVCNIQVEKLEKNCAESCLLCNHAHGKDCGKGGFLRAEGNSCLSLEKQKILSRNQILVYLVIGMVHVWDLLRDKITH